jgi:hypothetical protein
MKKIYFTILSIIALFITSPFLIAQDIEYTFDGADWEGWTGGGTNASWGGTLQNNPNGQLKIIPTDSGKLILYPPGHAASAGTAAMSTEYKYIQIKLRNLSGADQLWLRAKYSGTYDIIQEFSIGANDAINDQDYTTYNFEVTESAWTTAPNTTKWTFAFFDSANGAFTAQTEPKIFIDNILISKSSTLSTNNVSEIDFNIYPNPVQNTLKVDTREAVNSIQLFDVLGKQVLTAQNSNRIDVSSLDKAIYFAQIQTESGSSIKKFIKD